MVDNQILKDVALRMFLFTDAEEVYKSRNLTEVLIKLPLILFTHLASVVAMNTMKAKSSTITTALYLLISVAADPHSVAAFMFTVKTMECSATLHLPLAVFRHSRASG